MAKINGVRWGVHPENNKIREDLLQVTNEPVEEFTLTHLKSGFTDNVFLVQVKNSNYILKEFTEDWHLREIDVYKQILNKDKKLNAPQMLFYTENRMYLEYFPKSIYEAFDKSNIEFLFDWLIYKWHKYSKNAILQLVESEDIKKHYLFDKPLKKFQEVYESSLQFDRSIIKTLLNEKDQIERIFENKSNYLTLEHGDIESQNLFWNKEEKSLGIIDWTNAKFSDGLTDINQFLENCGNWGLNKQDYINKFGIELGLDNFSYFLKRNRLFMSLNKSHYYISKFEAGFEKSESNGHSTFDLAHKYLLISMQLIPELC